MVLRIPGFGKLIHESLLARFSLVLGITLKSGLPLQDALLFITEVINNYVGKQSIIKVREALVGGSSFYSAIAQGEIFDERIKQLIKIIL